VKPPAQDMPYWDTKTSLSKSESGIKDHLRAKNCKHVGSLYDEDKGELVVIFTFLDEPYRMAFHPLTPGRPVKPGVRLLAHGVSRRMAKLKALGNGVVPQCAEYIGRCILEEVAAING